jgi:hypothetical protein
VLIFWVHTLLPSVVFRSTPVPGPARLCCSHCFGGLRHTCNTRVCLYCTERCHTTVVCYYCLCSHSCGPCFEPSHAMVRHAVAVTAACTATSQDLSSWSVDGLYLYVKLMATSTYFTHFAPLSYLRTACDVPLYLASCDAVHSPCLYGCTCEQHALLWLMRPCFTGSGLLHFALCRGVVFPCLEPCS